MSEPSPASPEMLAELDGRMIDIWERVIELEIDDGMGEQERRGFYMFLRWIYARGRTDGAAEVCGKLASPETYT